MGRLQLVIDVGDLDEEIDFHSRLFSTQPAKVKEGYANLVIADPSLKRVLFEKPGEGGTLNHLVVDPFDSQRLGGGQSQAGRGVGDQRGRPVISRSIPGR
jgi:hypothetical protein